MRKFFSLFLILTAFSFVYAQKVSNVELDWVKINKVNAPELSKEVTDWIFYCGDPSTSIGVGGAASFGCYIHIPTSTLAAHDGRQIQEMQVQLPQPENVASIELQIYEEAGTGTPGTPIYTQVFTPNSNGEEWTTVVLTAPYTIDAAQEILIGYYIEASNGFPAGCDAGPINSEGNIMIWDGSWTHLSDLNSDLIYNWNIKAGIGDAVDNDAIMSAVTVDNIVVEGGVDVTGTVMNGGNNQINSFDLNWQIDDSEINTENITGLSLEYSDTYDFTHGNQWSATAGIYNLKVWVSNINGNGDDENPNNDEIQREIAVAIQSVERTPLYEQFTSSTCPPCFTFNTNYFTDEFLSDNEGTYTLIKYQMNWPGSGDPYYTSEGGARKDYYGVSSVPSLFLDAIEGTHFDSDLLQNALDNSNQMPAYFNVSGVHQLDGEDITVEVNIEPYLSGDYKVQIVVVENETTENATSNGETYFTNVMMKFLPHPGGSDISFTAGTPVVVTETINLSSTNIEEIEDLSVVVFVENQITKQIMQSAYSINGNISVDNNISENISIYPNPAADVINVTNYENTKIEIYNTIGELVISVNNTSSIDVSSLVTGTYIIKIITENITETKKINIIN